MAHRPDPVNVKDDGPKFTPHPSGQFAAVCVDTLNMGQKVETFPGTPEKLVKKCAVVFDANEKNPETGEPIYLVREFTISMGEKANLRQFLQLWRGKSYTDEEAEAGVPLHKLVGHAALITVEHKKSGKGRTYANITGIAPLPKQMKDAAPSGVGYERPEYLEERKTEYAEQARKFVASINHDDAPEPRSQRVQRSESGGTGLPEPDEMDDLSDLPF